MKRAILGSKTRFKKPIGNIHFGKMFLVLVVILMIQISIVASISNASSPLLSVSERINMPSIGVPIYYYDRGTEGTENFKFHNQGVMHYDLVVTNHANDPTKLSLSFNNIYMIWSYNVKDDWNYYNLHKQISVPLVEFKANDTIVGIPILEDNNYDYIRGYHYIKDSLKIDVPKRADGKLIIESSTQARLYQSYQDPEYGDMFYRYTKEPHISRKVTQTYIINSSPNIVVALPSENSYFGKEPNNKITISGNVKDSDNGDVLKVYYRINGTSGQAGTQLGGNITANGSNQAYSNTIAIPDSLTDGNHNLYVWVVDDKGANSGETAISFRVDKTNPTVPSIVVNENWSKDNVTATISSGTDGGSGVDRTEYSLSGATTLNWTTYSGPITISNEGLTTIEARSVDKVGNISNETSKIVKIDKTNPTKPDIEVNENWSKNNVTATITHGTDVGSGVDRTEYSLSGATIKSWTIYSGEVTISNEGQTTIKARTIDKTGNISSEDIKVVKIDKTNPASPTITVDENWSSNNVVAIVVNGADSVSGADKTEYSLSGATTLDWTTYSGEVTISNEGQTTISARTIDKAGNISPENTRIAKIDKTVPEINSTYNEDLTIDDLEIFIDIAVGDSGIQAKKWGKGEQDISYFASNGTILEDRIIVTDNGFITVYVKNGANVEVVKIIEINNAYKETYENAMLAVDKAVETNEESDIDLAQIEIDKIPDIFNDEKDALQTKIDTLKSIKAIEDIDGIRNIKNIINTKLGSYKYKDKLLEYLDDRIIAITDDKLVILEQKIADLKGYDENKYNDVISFISSLENYINEITDLDKKELQNNKLDKLVELVNIIIDFEELKDLVNIAENNKTQENVDIANDKADEIAIKINNLSEEEKIYFSSILNELIGRLDIIQQIIDINEELRDLKELIITAQNNKTDENINNSTTKADGIQDKIDILPDSSDKDLLQSQLEEFRKIIEVIEVLKDLELDVVEVEATKLQSLVNLCRNKGNVIQEKISNILDAEFEDKLQQDLDELLNRLNIVQKIINIIEDIGNIQDMEDVKDIYDLIENELKNHPERNDLVIDLVEKAIPIAETIEDIEYIETIIETLSDGPKKDELLDKLKDKLKEIIEKKLDELENTINDAEDKKIKDMIEDIIDKVEELEDLIDKAKEMGEDTTEYENRLEEAKDRLDIFKEVIDVILKLENVILNLETKPATLTLETFGENEGYNKRYKYLVTDLETNTIIAEGITVGEIIELNSVFDGHKYKLELEGYLNGEKVAEKTLEKIKTDKIEPELKYAYMLDGIITIHAIDNYKLHDAAYAFRILKENEDIEVIKNTVVDTEFGTIAWIVNDNETITNINYGANNKQNISSPYPKKVIVRIRDYFGNVTTKTFNIIKENEFLYGDVPQDIVDEINRKNNPPVVDHGPGNSNNDLNNNVGEKKDNNIVIDSKLPQEIKKEIEGILDNNNLEINPIDTESNSQKGGFNIDIKKELDKLNDLIKNQLGSSENTSYRITVTEKDTNRLVYTKTSKYRENLIIPNLHDSTIYNIKISLVLDGKELAFREIEKMTYDKTPPIIEKILVKNNAVEIVASDNIKLHNKAYQYTVNSNGKIAFMGSDLGDLEILILASSFDTNVWTEKSRLTGLDAGEKVTIIVRDHAENYTITEFEVKDGLVLDSVNNDKPLQLNKNSEIDVEELMTKILETYNEKNPDDKYDMSKFNKNDFTILSSNPNVAYFENDKLITKNPGTVIITLTDKNTGKSYRYLIIVSKYVAFDRRIVVQTNSETDLSRVFEEQLYKHFEGTPIYVFIKKGEAYGDIDVNIFKTFDAEGIVTIIATDGIKEVPFYVIVVEDEYPESDLEIILANIPYVIKKGDVIDIKEVSNFYNEFYEETNIDYLIAEVNNNVLDISENNVYALNEGIGVVSIIDLANNRIEEIDFRVVDFNKDVENNLDEKIDKHWAKDNIIKLANKNILDMDSEFNPEEGVTVVEFLTIISRTKTMIKSSDFERRNKLNLDNLVNEDNKHYIMDALNDFTMFEIEYIFNNNFNLDKNITREEMAVYLSLALDLKPTGKTEFDDIALSTRKNEIQAVKNHGIMVGYSQNTFKPTKHLTKAELATIINNIYQYQKNNALDN